MVIYADVLIFSNTVIDYALLLITSTILKAKCKTWRIITGSIIGGISTLYILLENNLLIVDLLVKLCIGFLITIITFGNRNFKILIFSYVIFLLISFSFNGLVMFLQMYFSETFVSNNLVYYINISPIFLILLTALFYMIIKTIQKILCRKNNIESAEIEIMFLDNICKTHALVDSGHTLTDPLSNSQIIIVNSDIYAKLIGNAIDLSTRIRYIPVDTVVKRELLEGVRCDFAKIKYGSNEILVNKPIILLSKQPIDGRYNAIISSSAVNEKSDI